MVTTLLRRLDTAEWNKVHVAITAAIGVGWLLDAFEVTIVTMLALKWAWSPSMDGSILTACDFRGLASRRCSIVSKRQKNSKEYSRH
jgi:hypothetical protein